MRDKSSVPFLARVAVVERGGALPADAAALRRRWSTFCEQPWAGGLPRVGRRATAQRTPEKAPCWVSAAPSRAWVWRACGGGGGGATPRGASPAGRRHLDSTAAVLHQTAARPRARAQSCRWQRRWRWRWLHAMRQPTYLGVSMGRQPVPPPPQRQPPLRWCEPFPASYSGTSPPFPTTFPDVTARDLPPHQPPRSCRPSFLRHPVGGVLWRANQPTCLSSCSGGAVSRLWETIECGHVPKRGHPPHHDELSKL